MTEIRRCEYRRCRKPLERKRYTSGKLEKLGGWEKRRFCSNKCKDTARRVKAPTRYCRCGARLIRKKQPNGRLENMKDFLGRRRCVGCLTAVQRAAKTRRKAQQPKPQVNIPPAPLRTVQSPTEQRRLPNPVKEQFTVSAPEPVGRNGSCKDCSRPLNAWKVCGYCSQRAGWVEGQKARLSRPPVTFG